ncbi:hypothetical protein AXF42_Ash012684 [Apostasia shenzhenica]|uniref:Uncharacterized protein n=1 Tax=Apostasia shenzhenica TaxID=1088818 RepID=A0A2H9ZTC8_9ASPA|nr:hypothetical protein AXF42_Ash012684 [Apostasia shenzhenica]
MVRTAACRAGRAPDDGTNEDECGAKAQLKGGRAVVGSGVGTAEPCKAAFWGRCAALMEMKQKPGLATGRHCLDGVKETNSRDLRGGNETNLDQFYLLGFPVSNIQM